MTEPVFVSDIKTEPKTEPKQKISTSLRLLHEKFDNISTIITRERDIIDLRSQLQQSDADHNIYSSTKSVGQQFLNISVITNYIQILVNLFNTPLTGFDIALIVLISISLINQGFIFIIITILYKANNNQISKNCTAPMLNNLVTTLTALTVIINIPIAVLVSSKNTMITTNK